MIYYTGDTHGEVEKLLRFKHRMDLTVEDTVVILGDAGWNYDMGMHDQLAKMYLKRFGITVFSIHGNHEERMARRQSLCGGRIPKHPLCKGRRSL